MSYPVHIYKLEYSILK